MKPVTFFVEYSGEAIDEIRQWITEDLHLSLGAIDWIGFSPVQYGANSEVRLRVIVITKTGEEHETDTSTMGILSYTRLSQAAIEQRAKELLEDTRPASMTIEMMYQGDKYKGVVWRVGETTE